jgi:cyanophycinase
MASVRTLLSVILASIFLLPALVCLSPLPAQDKAGPRERLRPAGIDGTLLLCGEGKVPEAVLKRFLELAGGDKAQMVLLAANAGDAEKAAVRTLTEEMQACKPASLTVLSAWAPAGAAADTARDALRKATGVWIAGGKADEKLGPAVETELREFLKRKGVLAAAGRSAALTGHRLLIAEAGPARTAKGWDFLPGAILDLSPNPEDAVKHFRTALTKEPGLFGIGIPEGSALLVQGRQMRVLGEGRVVAYLAEAAPRPERTLTWPAGAKADLTALRRAAVERGGPRFPPEKMATPEVPHGTLFINGGGGMPKGGAERFIELAGGKDALIVVFPTANPDPVPLTEGRFLSKAGATNVHVLPARDLADVESPQFLDVLKKAQGVWFGGGRQWRFVDAYAGTKAEPLLRDVLRRGGVIGGGSAGASIQGEYMPRGNPLGNLDIMAEGYERGLSYLPGVAVDQHFSQRKRHADMTALMKTYPQVLGVGLDEKTAIVVKGHVAEVMGTGKAHFYDRRRPVAEGAPDYEALTNGGRYDLKARKVLTAETK